MDLNQQVRSYWEQEPCGTDKGIVGELEPLSREWFEQIEAHRYAVEPFIHSAVQFTRHRGKTMLEVGVGAGTDHLQWARAGCICHGVDLTEAAIETTRARLRGAFIKRAKERKRDYTVDWVHLKLNDQAQRTVLCKDPFRSHDERVEKLIASL